jgi:hypothetical protein
MSTDEIRERLRDTLFDHQAEIAMRRPWPYASSIRVREPLDVLECEFCRWDHRTCRTTRMCAAHREKYGLPRLESLVVWDHVPARPEHTTVTPLPQRAHAAHTQRTPPVRPVDMDVEIQ